MEITNTHVYNMTEALVASGFPMLTEFSADKFEDECEATVNDEVLGMTDNHVHLRAARLASNPPGTGHNNFLSGIIVTCNITATVKWWVQYERYHFQQIVSGMSTMHRMRQMVQEDTIRFSKNTNPGIISAFKMLLQDKSITDEELVDSCPMGLELTDHVVLNYLQLKTMYFQRTGHKYSPWDEFRAWIEGLPHAKELICKKKEKELKA